GRARRRLSGVLFLLRQRQGDGKAAAHARSAFSLDLSTVQFGDQLHQRKPQPRAAGVARAVALIEALEDVGKGVWLDAWAVVFHDEAGRFALRARGDAYTPALAP